MMWPAPKQLAGAIDGGKHFLGGDGAVEGGDGSAAIVAMAAIGLHVLAEAAQERAGAAGRGFGEGDHGLEAFAHDGFLRLGGDALGEPVAGAGDVLAAIKQDGVGGLAVAAGAADLLVVGFGAVGHVEMDDEADVWTVDAHAEGDGGDDDDRLAAAEAGEGDALFHGRQAGVKGDGGVALGAEAVGDAFGLVAAAAVDDAGLAAVLGEDGEQFGGFALLGLGGDVQVGAVEAGGEDLGRAHVERGQDVVAGAGVGGGGERDAGDAGEALGELGEAAVFGAELVTPGADAVGFVDGEEGDALAGEALERAGHEQAFGGNVEQVELAGIEEGGGFAGGGGLDFGVEGAGAGAELAEGGDLVVHEGDEGGDDDGGAGQAEGGNLVAKALAAAGGHEDEGVAAAHDAVDDGGLQAAERRVTEDAAEHVIGRLEARLGAAGGHGRRPAVWRRDARWRS